MELFVYLIKANIAIALFYGCYRLFLGRDTFFYWKRFVLLFILFFSAVYPLMHIPGWMANIGNDLATNSPISIYLNEIIVSSGQQQETGFSLLGLIVIIYSGGVTFLLIRTIIELTTVLHIYLRSQKTTINEYCLYMNREIKTPFSFFNMMVINPENHTDKELEEIIIHERTHIRQIHSLDMIIGELFCIFSWFNPFAWLIRNEIRINLEYLADRTVLDAGCDSQQYQFHLLRLTYNKAAAKIINNFNVSPLKQRILMMNKQQTKRSGFAKYILFAPLIAGLLFFNYNADAKEQEESTQSDSVNDDQVFTRAEVMPSFPEGENALYKWLSENINYPEEAVKNNESGVVFLRFVIDKEGKAIDPEIIKSPDSPSLQAEAMRVFSILPDFIPGKQDGKPIKVFFVLPISFNLPDQ